MTQVQLKKQAWLKRAFYREKSAKAWADRCEKYQSIAERGRKSGANSNFKNVTEEAYINLADIQHKAEKSSSAYQEVYTEIKSAITAIADEELQAILIYHYLNHRSFEYIAEKMRCSVSTVKRKHLKALNKLEISSQNDTE